MSSTQRPDSRDGFEIAIICALRIERDAIEALLDKDYEEDGFSYGKTAGDANVYTIGRLGNQNIVLAYMPDMGTISAAAVAANLCSSFHNIKVAFVVGVCGGVPQSPNGSDIFLGDIIISTEVCQIDFGRQYSNQFVRKKGVQETLGRARPEIRAFVGKLSGHLVSTRMRSKINTYINSLCIRDGFTQSKYPGRSVDVLYTSTHSHKHWSQFCPVCDHCDSSGDSVCGSALKSSCTDLGCAKGVGIRRNRSSRPSDIGTSLEDWAEMEASMPAPIPEVHFGQIACGNQVMKSGLHRDLIARDEKIIGFEMESAGTWDYIPTIIIKSVCDYADSHKDKRWQGYSTVTAAACTKAVLEEWRSVNPTPPTAKKRRNSESAYTTNPVHWTITRSKNVLFTGRNVVLEDLEKSIHDAITRRASCWVAVTGIGGQGKSEICLQIAHKLKPLFWGIFWIDVSTPALAESGFVDIAERLRLSDQNREGVRRSLANIRQPWLLVLDNADDPNVDYQTYFPTGSRGVVILTSRNPECQQYATSCHIDLQGLSKDEARELLYQAIRLPHAQRESLQDDADAVADLLQSHALALIQAGAYISRGHCSLKGYPAIYRQNRKRLLVYRPSQARSRHGDVYATFEASAEVLKSSNDESASDALQLLAILSFCGPNRFPLSLFETAWRGARGTLLDQTVDHNDPDSLALTRWHVSHLPSFIDVSHDEWDSFRVLEAVNMLQAFSLITIDASSDISNISMHPLVHAWARDRLSAEQQHAAWVTMGCVAAFSHHQADLWWKHVRLIQVHLQTLISWELSKMFGDNDLKPICGVLLSCGYQLKNMRDDNQLFNLVSGLIRHLGLDCLQVVPQWLELYTLVALSYHNKAKFKDSIIIWKQILQARVDSPEQEHSDKLFVKFNLALAYEANGQVQEAITLLEDIVRIQVQSLAEDHPSRLTSEQALAQAYTDNSQVDKAISLLEHIVQVKRQLLPEDHPSRLASEHALGQAYRVNGQIDEATSLLMQIVWIRAELLSEDHPDRLASEHSLAQAFRANGHIQAAICILEHVVRIWTLSLVEDHPNRLASEHTLAQAYRADGQVKKAISILERVVRIQAESLAEDHPSRLMSEYALAQAYIDDFRFQKAQTLLENIVQIEARSLAEEHLNRLISEHTLAQAHEAGGQLDNAISLLEHVVQLEAQSLTEDHPDRLGPLYNLGIFYGKVGRHEDSVSTLQRVVDIMRQVPNKYYCFREHAENELMTELEMGDASPSQRSSRGTISLPTIYSTQV